MLTVITPVYNRENKLVNAYNSLLSQTNHDFEWIIVDDGSTDNSLDIARSFETELFNIKVLSKKNGGKHTAINYAINYIRGDYVLILDSDDELTADAVDTIYTEWAKHYDEPRIGLLIFLRGIDIDHPLCTVDQYNVPVDFMLCKRNHLISRDCCEVLRTNVLTKFHFPEFENEKFIGESALWNRISFHYKCVYKEKIIYLCQYQSDGLTNAGRKMRLKNPNGGMYVANLEMDKKNNLLKRLKFGVLYTCYGKFAHKTLKEMKNGNSNKLLFWITYPIGLIAFLYWRKKYNE